MYRTPKQNSGEKYSLTPLQKLVAAIGATAAIAVLAGVLPGSENQTDKGPTPITQEAKKPQARQLPSAEDLRLMEQLNHTPFERTLSKSIAAGEKQRTMLGYLEFKP